MKPLENVVSPRDHLLRRASTRGGKTPLVPRHIDARKVVEVALNPDDELRNLQVALLYSLSSARMDEKLHGVREIGHPIAWNANWFTIAQWAVLTVGRNLRTTAMPHRAALLPASLRRRLTPAVMSLRAADDRRVAAALSYGQVMVFVSVYQALLNTDFADGAATGSWVAENDGPPISEVGHVDGIVPTKDPVKGDTDVISVEMTQQVAQDLSDFSQMLKADEAAAAEEEAEAEEAQRLTVIELARQMGADVSRLGKLTGDRFYRSVLDCLAAPAGYHKELQKAFDLYERAAPWHVKGTEDPPLSEGELKREPADLIFEANLRIAAIEQVILDQAVTEVVNHVPRYLAQQAEGRLATFAERSLRVPRRIAQMNASRRMASASAVAMDVWARVMTDQVMVVAFPAETIRLGRDIPRKDWTKPFYAPGLEELSPTAERLFNQFDRSLGDGRGAGAGDWRRFDDRMNFVSNLLRSRQQDLTLFWQPFTDEDVVKVWNGAYPSRIADPFEQAVRSPAFPVDMNPEDLDTKSCDEMEEVGLATYQIEPAEQGLPIPGEQETGSQ